MQHLITDHLDIWTAAHKTRSTAGRGSNNRLDLVGIKKLRELILELAVRGKLVPQDPNDEPASELLKRIAEEKAKLVKEGKIKKEKPLPEITDEERPSELPNGWECIRLGNIASIKGGKRLPNGHSFSAEATSHIYIRVTDMKNGTINDDGLVFIGPETYSLISQYVISSNDLYITIAGTIGVVGIVPQQFDGMNLTENAAKLIFRIVNKSWLQKTLSSIYIQEQFHEKTNQLAQPKLALHRIESSIVFLPPLPEQHRIVAKVDELIAFCDQLEQTQSDNIAAHVQLVEALLATLTNSSDHNELQNNWQRIAAHFDILFTTEHSIDQLKQTILQLAVMGKLVPQDPNDEPASELLKKIAAEKAQLIKEGKIKKEKPLPEITEDEKPFELPSGWEFVRQDEISQLITKGSSPKWQGISYTENENDVLFVTSENVGSYQLLIDSKKYVEKKFNEIEPRSILLKGDFLMNIVGGSIGRTAIFNIDAIANINQAVCLIRIIESNLNPVFMLHFYNSEVCISYMFDKQVDNARANLSMGNIGKFVIPVPPLQEQHRIVTKVNELMTLCDTLKTNLQNAQTTQLALADALVEGAMK